MSQRSTSIDHAGQPGKREAGLALGAGADGPVIRLSGDWVSATVGAVDKDLRKMAAEAAGSGKPVGIDAGDVTVLDTAGAWMIVRTAQALGPGGSVRMTGMADTHRMLVEEVETSIGPAGKAAAPVRPGLAAGMLAAVGRNVYGMRRDVVMSLHMLGAAVRGSQLKLGHRNDISLAPVISQIDKMGIRAIPIIVLMSTIIGAIIAQQGAFQLRYFGAEIFVVDLVAILVLREIGVLLTAIMIAGRSGSAITAEIGSMKMREEVDALTVIGLNPIGVLVFPRLVALVIALPLLTFIANMSALAGAMFVAQTYSGVSPDAFIARTRDAIDLTTFYAGIIKAPFMAIIIGIIASVEGMKVGGSAESLGARVTSAVVKSIFVVIVVDGLFAMFFAAVDF